MEKVLQVFSVEVKNVIASLDENDSVLVLADIVGGSPLTICCNSIRRIGKLENATILGGMNLTMALTAVVMKDILTGSELVSTILNESSSALQELKSDRMIILMKKTIFSV